jgi:hypothetical protein
VPLCTKEVIALIVPPGLPAESGGEASRKTSDSSVNSNKEISALGLSPEEIISESDLIEVLDFNEFNIPKERGYPL